MSKGKIKNFTLAGDALMLTAMVDKSGDTRYQLDTSLAFGETLTYEGLVTCWRRSSRTSTMCLSLA